MKKIILSLFIITCLCGTVYADTITIVADPWLPFTGQVKGNQGYILEVAEAAFKLEGHTVKYKVIPWKRAVDQCRKGKFSAIAGAYKSDAPDFIFPANHLGYSSPAFFVLNNSNWEYKGIKSLKNVKIGGIKGYSYGKQVDRYIKNNKSKTVMLSGISPLKNLINMLIAKRIDVFVEDSAVGLYTLKKLKKQNEIKKVSQLKLNKLYIAFSPSNPKSKEYAKILSNGIIKLRKSGQLKKILAKYGLSLWR